MKFHFGHKILYLKLRLYVKSRFIKSRLYCNLISNKKSAQIKCIPIVLNFGVIPKDSFQCILPKKIHVSKIMHM